jgi:uncharacterized protein (TIGR03435 family)
MLPSMIGPTSNGDVYQVRYAIMVDLIKMAYGVDKDKVIGGPNWISMYRFDVKAKAPAPLTAESVRQMLKSLLAERFHLVARPGTKPVEGYLLRAGKHAQLKQATGTEEFGGCRTALPRPAQGGMAGEAPAAQMVTVTCLKVTMEEFTDAVRNLPRATRASGSPLIADETGLKGAWNFEFQYDVAKTRGDNNTAFIPVFEEQLGLKLEAGMVPAPVVEVETMDFEPTPNPPELAKYFPPPPTEFEVAEVKPSAPAAPGTRQVYEMKNGRMILTGMPLSSLIRMAWDMEGMELAGAPKWLDTARFDIVAKAPEGTLVGTLISVMDFEAVRPMLQNLLIRKFQLKMHTEERPADAYVLKAVKPKLVATSDPNKRALWHDGPPYATKDPIILNPALGRIITGTNLTMKEFARLLPGMDPSAFERPVRDATGIEGHYDFTINFERYAILTGGRGGTLVFTPSGMGMVGGGGEANPDPSGKLSIYEAVSKQLGLKLELEKRPFPVMVLDSIKEKPLEN